MADCMGMPRAIGNDLGSTEGRKTTYDNGPRKGLINDKAFFVWKVQTAVRGAGAAKYVQ